MTQIYEPVAQYQRTRHAAAIMWARRDAAWEQMTVKGVYDYAWINELLKAAVMLQDLAATQYRLFWEKRAEWDALQADAVEL